MIYDVPRDLRTAEESKFLAVETARAAFAVNPSVNAFVLGSYVQLVNMDNEDGGSMDLEMASRFGAEA